MPIQCFFLVKQTFLRDLAASSDLSFCETYSQAKVCWTLFPFPEVSCSSSEVFYSAFSWLDWQDYHFLYGCADYICYLVSEKETIQRAIPHLKNSGGPAFKSELNKGISRPEQRIWPCSCCWSTTGVSPSHSQPLHPYNRHSWESEGDNRHQCRLAFLQGVFLARLPLTAYRCHHPWSHYSLASSQKKLEVLRLLKNIPYKVGASCTLLKKKPSFSLSINLWPVQPSCVH